MKTHHKIEVDVVNAEALQRALNAFFDPLVPRVVEFGGDPNFFARDARVLDALANLVLIAIRQSSVDVSITRLQSSFHGLADLVGLGLPGAQADSGHLCTRVKGDSLFGPSFGCHSVDRVY